MDDMVTIAVPVETKRKLAAWRERHEAHIGRPVSDAEAIQALFTPPLESRDEPLRRSLVHWARVSKAMDGDLVAGCRLALL